MEPTEQKRGAMICPWKAPWAVREGRGDALAWTAAYGKQMCKLGNTSDKSEPIWLLSLSRAFRVTAAMKATQFLF